VLVGRSISSLIHSTIGIVVMGLTGLTIGWRIRDGFVNAVFAYVILLAFGFSLIWLGIWVGSIMHSVEAVQGFMFTVIFPLTFVANTFAPTEGMPSWLRTLAEWNPVSAVTASLRELWGNDGGLGAPPGSAWPLEHPEIMSLAWSVVFTAIFAPMAVRAFRRRARD
jgi:ABC-type polysaccharide/polyol phosphate export permease